MPQRSIVHLDADAFFAAVEQAADPKLRGKPIAVGGEKHGIIASASYEARRFSEAAGIPASHIESAALGRTGQKVPHQRGRNGGVNRSVKGRRGSRALARPPVALKLV
jgi:hypothetical protein